MSDYLQSRAYQAFLYWDNVARQAGTKAATQKSSGQKTQTSVTPQKSSGQKARTPVTTSDKSQVRAEVNTASLDRLLESWDKLLREFPQMKKATLEKMGSELLRRVRGEIGGTGKVAGWQVPHMGSGGGYVAVRAKANTYQATKSGKRYAVGYITNAFEGGHKIRKHQGGKGYRSRVNVAAVSGRWSYDAVRRQLAGMSQEDVDALMTLITDGLEGRL